MDTFAESEEPSTEDEAEGYLIPATAICSGLLTLLLFGYHAYNLWLGGPREILTRFALMPAILVLIASSISALGTKRIWYRARLRSLVFLLVGLNAVILIVFSYTPLSVYLYDLGSERHVRSVSDLSQLRTWANDVLSKPESSLPGKKQGGYFMFDKDKLPPFVKQIPLKSFMTIYIRTLKEDGQRSIWIPVYAGRPHSYGILLCPSGQAPKPSSGGWIRKWQDGIYGWQGTNEIS